MPNLRSPQTLVAVSLLAAVTFAACQPKEAATPASPSPAAMEKSTPSQAESAIPPIAMTAASESSMTAEEIGTWTKTGDKYDITTTYQSPAGLHEHVEFNVGVKDGVITSVEVTPKAVNPTSQKMQTQFKGAASTALVGKKLSTLTKVDRIGGASFTTGAFNKVLEALKQKAV